MPTRNFLGSSGAASVVLLNCPDPAVLPKLPEARRLFQVDEIKHYKGDGWYMDDIARLERALEIVKGMTPPPWMDVSTTDFLLMAPNTPPSIFFTLKYAAILVHGFNLTDECMEDLASHVDTHSKVVRWRNRVNDFYEGLRDQSASAQESNIQDPSILNPDILGVERILDGYGDSALAEATESIKLWYSFHKW